MLSAALCGKCRHRRLIKKRGTTGQSPASPINEVCGDWAGTHAAYRLFDNSKVSPETILQPHTARTVQRMAGHAGPVLVTQDTLSSSPTVCIPRHVDGVRSARATVPASTD